MQQPRIKSFLELFEKRGHVSASLQQAPVAGDRDSEPARPASEHGPAAWPMVGTGAPAPASTDAQQHSDAQASREPVPRPPAARPASRAAALR